MLHLLHVWLCALSSDSGAAARTAERSSRGWMWPRGVNSGGVNRYRTMREPVRRLPLHFALGSGRRALTRELSPDPLQFVNFCLLSLDNLFGNRAQLLVGRLLERRL